MINIWSTLKKKIKKSPKKLQEPPMIEVEKEIPNIEVLEESFKLFFINFDGGGGSETYEIDDFEEKNSQNGKIFKILTPKEQLVALLGYIKERSKEGKYEKEGDRIIANFFGVSKDLINKRFKFLVENNYIEEIRNFKRNYIIKKEEIELWLNLLITF